MKASNLVVRQLALPAQSDNPTQIPNPGEPRQDLLTILLHSSRLLVQEQLLVDYRSFEREEGPRLKRRLMKGLAALTRRQSVVPSSTILSAGYVV